LGAAGYDAAGAGGNGAAQTRDGNITDAGDGASGLVLTNQFGIGGGGGGGGGMGFFLISSPNASVNPEALLSPNPDLQVD